MCHSQYLCVCVCVWHFNIKLHQTTKNVLESLLLMVFLLSLNFSLNKNIFIHSCVTNSHKLMYQYSCLTDEGYQENVLSRHSAHTHMCNVHFLVHYFFLLQLLLFSCWCCFGNSSCIYLPLLIQRMMMMTQVKRSQIAFIDTHFSLYAYLSHLL